MERGSEKLPGVKLIAWMFCGNTRDELEVVLPATTGMPTVNTRTESLVYNNTIFFSFFVIQRTKKNCPTSNVCAAVVVVEVDDCVLMTIH